MNVASRKERGQARLPDLELIKVEFKSLIDRRPRQDQPSESVSLSGWEGGLPPQRGCPAGDPGFAMVE